LTRLTGSDFVAALSDFFSAIDAMAPDIRETNLLAQRLLLDPSAAFVLISSFDLAKIQEGEAFHDELARAGFHLRKVIVNRAWPQWTLADSAPRAAVRKALLERGERKLAELHAALADYYAARRSLHTRFADLLILPEMDDEIVGLAALERVAAQLVPEA
jgi:anion-transporting  ArsA/GET3 family ATPase